MVHVGKLRQASRGLHSRVAASATVRQTLYYEQGMHGDQRLQGSSSQCAMETLSKIYKDTQNGTWYINWYWNVCSRSRNAGDPPCLTACFAVLRSTAPSTICSTTYQLTYQFALREISVESFSLLSSLAVTTSRRCSNITYTILYVF